MQEIEDKIMESKEKIAMTSTKSKKVEAVKAAAEAAKKSAASAPSGAVVADAEEDFEEFNPADDE